LTHPESNPRIDAALRSLPGEVEPQPDARDRLLQLHYVARQLIEVLGLTPSDANTWLFEPNQLLQGDTPADRLARGEFRMVLGLIEALADGVVP